MGVCASASLRSQSATGYSSAVDFQRGRQHFEDVGHETESPLSDVKVKTGCLLKAEGKKKYHLRKAESGVEFVFIVSKLM